MAVPAALVAARLRADDSLGACRQPFCSNEGCVWVGVVEVLRVDVCARVAGGVLRFWSLAADFKREPRSRGA